MELKKREEIIIALECCSVYNDCNGCPYYHGPAVGCAGNVMREAIALIQELTEEIKDLEADYDRVYAQAEADIRGNMADGGTSCHWCIAGHRADTIREMRDRLSDKALDKYPYVGYIDVFDMEDVAKEMLEENNV